MTKLEENHLVKIDYRDAAWKSFLDKTEHTIFHTSKWQEVVGRAYGSEPVIYGYCRDGEIRSAIVGFVFNWKICKVFYATLFDGGIVGDRGVIVEFINLLFAQLKKDRIDKIRIMKTYSTPLDKIPDFKEIKASQHVVDLDSIDEKTLWNKLYRNRIRRSVRQARSEGVTIKEIENIEEVKVLYKLNRETIRRSRTFSTFSESLLVDFYQCFLRTGQGKAWLAKKDDIYIAGLLVVYSKTASHGMVGGSLGEYFNLRANDLLLHEALVDAIRKRKLYFDFMASPQDKEQLKFYKIKFGAKEYPASLYEKNISSIRSAVWDMIWRVIHTPFGGWILRSIHIKKRGA